MIFPISMNIKHYRQLKKMTQKDLAALIGVDTSVINRYETGVIAVPYDRIIQLAKALDVTPIKLMGLEDNSHDEEEIFDIFHKLTPENKNKLVDFAKMMLIAQETNK